MKRYFSAGHSHYIVSVLLLMVDVILLSVIFYISFLFRNWLTPWIGSSISWDAVRPVVQMGVLLTVGVFALYDLYPGYGLASVREMERTSRALGMVFLFLATTFYLNKPFQTLPRSLLLLSGGLAFWVIPLGRFALRRWIAYLSWYGIPVVVYGELEEAQHIAKILKYVPRLGWRVQEVLPLSAIVDNTTAFRTQIALLALSPQVESAPYARVLAQRYRRVILVQGHSHFGSLWVETRDLSGKLGLEFRYHLLRPFNRWLKRAMDIIGAVGLVLFFAPFMLFLVFLIKLDSRGPVFFRQDRLGKNFENFKVFKFRTMTTDAEARLAKILAQNPIARAQYEKYHKLSHDPRVTKVGYWLRKFSLDELPQLLNVLRGEMSLVGPRAYMPSELEEMGEYAHIILRVRPGMTGWWQVQGRHNTTFQKRLEMDEYYISNWSLWMDVFILLKTVWVVLSGQGG